MINFVNFSTENHLLSLFFRVRIELILLKILNIKRPNYFLRISPFSKSEQQNKY